VFPPQTGRFATLRKTHLCSQKRSDLPMRVPLRICMIAPSHFTGSQAQHDAPVRIRRPLQFPASSLENARGKTKMKTLLIILVALVALPLLAGVQQVSMRANAWPVTGWSKNTQVYSAAPLRPYFDFPEGTDISVNYMFQSRGRPLSAVRCP